MMRPRLAEWLLRLVSPPEDVEHVLADLDEACASSPRISYWSETLASLLPLLIRRLETRRRAPASPLRGDMGHALLSDLRYALRISRATPLVTVAVVLTMLLGIGAVTAVFSVADVVLLRPLPFPESERVLRLGGVLRDGREIENLAYPDLKDFRANVRSLQVVSAVTRASVTLSGDGEPRQLDAAQTDAYYPDVFALQPVVGRWFEPDEYEVEGPKAVVLTNSFWQVAYGGDRDIVGRTITLDNEPHTVVGILPARSFVYPGPYLDAILPLRIYPGSIMENRGAMWIGAVAKLAPGATLEQARSDARAVARRLAGEYPDSNEGIGVHVASLHEAVVGGVGEMLLLVAGAVLGVLLIASLNVGNLLLSRAQARVREFAVRTALGGTPGRIRRQVFTETAVLAVAGGVLGVALAPVLTRALLDAYPAGLPRAGEVGMDGRVLAAAIMASVLASLLATLPTLRRAGARTTERWLREGGRSGSGREAARFGNAMVVVQVALSVALLFGSVLLVNTFLKLNRVDPGFEPRNVLSFWVFPSNARYPDRAAIERYYGEVAAGLSRIPGVEGVATATHIPFAGGYFGDVFEREDRGDQGVDNPRANIVRATPGLERVLGIPLLRGRALAATDDTLAENVVVINAALASAVYPGEDPVGHTIRWQGGRWRIVGVLGSTRESGLGDEHIPMLYAPAAQLPRIARYVVIRTRTIDDGLHAQVRRALQQVDPTVALTDVRTMEDRVAESLAPQRFRASLIATLGALALILSAIGIYGVVAYGVERRVREIGIRVAIGADAAVVFRQTVGNALKLALIGSAIGAAAALAIGRLLASVLFNVSPADPLLLGASIIALLIIATLAAAAPARRVSAIDPLRALRAE